MEPIGLGDLVSMLGIILVNGVALASSFTKLNIRISENSKDILAIQTDIEEHKRTNKCDLQDFRTAMTAERLENKNELDKISIELAEFYNLSLDVKLNRKIPCKRMPKKLSSVGELGAVESMNKEIILIFRKNKI